jgi:hypothetical protein
LKFCTKKNIKDFLSEILQSIVHLAHKNYRLCMLNKYRCGITVEILRALEELLLGSYCNIIIVEAEIFY